MTQMRYLKPSVQMEPLVHRWYAWPHLIAPVPAAFNTLKRHLPIMESYVADPAMHASAVHDPDLVGGPFLDYGVQRMSDVRQLLEWTRESCRGQLELAAAAKVLNDLVLARGNGGSLEPLYAAVPELLKGLVELVYDVNHQPAVRYLEALVYRSSLYDESAQSLAFTPSDGDRRKFVLSTPRLDDDRSVITPLPFRSASIDRLFAMRSAAGDLDAVADLFRTSASIDATLADFFTESPPRRPAPYTGSRPRVRYFGHACVLIETAGTSILVDPAVSYDYPAEIHRYTYLDLPERIDHVLLTHNHQDHVMLETLLQLRHRIGSIVVPAGGSGALHDPSLATMLRALGFADVRSLDVLEQLDIDGGSILAVPFLGEHSDLDTSKTAWVVDLGGRTIFLGADSRNIENAMYERLARIIGPPDLMFIGMECVGAPLSWVYGPLMMTPISREKDLSRRLNGSDSAMVGRMVDTLRPGQVFIYALGQEPWLNHVMGVRYTSESPAIVESGLVLDACRASGIPAERLFGSRELIL
jgi:L-ascorbate metabolism protein UlaG (beta-lactamase superfamily)